VFHRLQDLGPPLILPAQQWGAPMTLVLRVVLVLAMLAIARPSFASRPNFVVILTDDQSMAMRVAVPRTGRLIGRAGVDFRRAYVNVSLCSPSRATILTGQYATNHGVECNAGPDGGFRGFQKHGIERRTVALLLQRVGYRTALVGKYVNGYPGGERAYVPPGWSTWVGSVWGSIDEGFGYRLNEDGRTVEYGERADEYATDVLVRKAQSFIRSSGAAGKPFFLLFAPSAPHAPAVPAPRHAGLFSDARAPRALAFNEKNVADKPRFLWLPALDAQAMAGRDAQWRRELRSLVAVDEAVEQLHATLVATGLLESTYLIFLSDNGLKAGEHRIPSGKNTLYEPDLRIPLMVSGPGVRSGLIDNEHLITNADIAPTILTLAGLQVPASMDGRSFHRILRGQKLLTPWRRAFPVARWPADSIEDPDPWPTARGVRTDRYTWVEWANGARELYDNLADPYQLENLAWSLGLDELRAELARLTATLASCRGEACRKAELQAPP
jgi:arylsulfatase A-like enzyme